MKGPLVSISDLAFTRRAFHSLALGALAATAAPALQGPRVLVIVAHPDDEYHFAVTIFRIVRELGGTVDQLIITNGEGGFRYSVLAEALYGERLTEEPVARDRLPEIRKQETLSAGRILGIRQHYFLDQKDTGYTLDAGETLASWDRSSILYSISRVMSAHEYDFVFTMLPSVPTHGHHKAATLLTLDAVAALDPEQRPVVLAAEAISSADAATFRDLAGFPLSRVAADTHDVPRSTPFGFQRALNYQIVANWVIAEHKSQGLFQMDANRHDVERFWRFELGGEPSRKRAAELFAALAGKGAAQ